MNETPTLHTLTEHLGYEVKGIDLSKPLPTGASDLLRGALATRGLLVFRGQDIDTEQQATFARIFGRFTKQGPVHSVSPDCTYISNARDDGAFGNGELQFHFDHSYYEHPIKVLMLYGIEIPQDGGQTLFTSSAAAVRRLPEKLRQRLVGRKVLNAIDYATLLQDRRDLDQIKTQAWHPAVATHEASGQQILMITRERSKQFDDAQGQEARDLVEAAHAVLSDPAVVYRHDWRKGDLLVWDNLLLQHARTPFDSDQKRTLRRCAIANDREPIAANQ